MIWKVIALALIGVIAVAALRQVKPELAIAGALAAGALIVFTVLDEVTGIVSAFQGLTETGGSGEGSVNASLFNAVIKIIGIGYITEYAASICDDHGSKSLGRNVQLAGKVTIFGMAVPVILSVLDAVRLIIQ